MDYLLVLQPEARIRVLAKPLCSTITSGLSLASSDLVEAWSTGLAWVATSSPISASDAACWGPHLFFSLCVVCSYVCTCMWRSEHILGCHSSGTIHLVILETGFLTDLKLTK